MDHAYKGQLQSYALKHNLDLPVYATQREGPAHAPRFRCNVTVSGQTFQCPDFFPTLKAAEHAAAKIALDSLAAHSPEVMDIAYKNLLQEIAQKENSPLPVYATSTSGPSHGPTFTSTVEFAGKAFTGEAAKTKKLAEMSAAKVAYLSIKSGNLNQTTLPCSPFPCERQETAISNVKSSVQEIPSQSSKTMTPDVPSEWTDVYENELPNVTAVVKQGKKLNFASPMPENPTKALKTSYATAASSPMPQNPTSNGPLTALSTNATKMSISVDSTKDGNESSLSEEETEYKFVMGTGHLSIPTGQHVVVRPWNPEMTLPQDSETVFKDDKFIAYRLLKPEN